MIEDVEDDVDEIPYSDFSKAAAGLFDIIYNGKAGVLPYYTFVYLIETLREGFIVRIWWIICGNYIQMKVVVWTVLHL